MLLKFFSAVSLSAVYITANAQNPELEKSIEWLGRSEQVRATNGPFTMSTKSERRNQKITIKPDCSAEINYGVVMFEGAPVMETKEIFNFKGASITKGSKENSLTIKGPDKSFTATTKINGKEEKFTSSSVSLYVLPEKRNEFHDALAKLASQCGKAG